MASAAPRPSFLALPAELRLQVYEDYLSKFSCPDIQSIYADIFPSKYVYSMLPLLLVNKKISEEILYLLRKRTEYIYRITWQDAGFDGLAMSCMRARNIHPHDYASLSHIRVEIYPPRLNCPSEIINIIGSVRELCKEFRKLNQLQRISVVFTETDFASWFTGELPRMYIAEWREYDGRFDYRDVLHSFAALRNITKASIEFQGTPRQQVLLLNDREFTLPEEIARHEQSMMNINLLDRKDVVMEIIFLERELESAETTLSEWIRRRQAWEKSKSKAIRVMAPYN